MSSNTNKAAVKTIPGATENLAVLSASATTFDLTAYAGKYISLVPVGGIAYMFAANTETAADALAPVATAGANRGYDIGDGVKEDFMVTKNKQWIRVRGSADLTLQVYDTSSH